MYFAELTVKKPDYTIVAEGVVQSDDVYSELDTLLLDVLDEIEEFNLEHICVTLNAAAQELFEGSAEVPVFYKVHLVVPNHLRETKITYVFTPEDAGFDSEDIDAGEPDRCETVCR